MSCSRWMATSLSSGPLRPFLHHSVYSCHLSLMSSESVSSLLFLSFIVPIIAWNISLIPPVFLKGFLLFLFLLFPSVSLQCSLKKALLSLLAFLWNSAFGLVHLSHFLLPFASQSYYAFISKVISVLSFLSQDLCVCLTLLTIVSQCSVTLY